MATKSSPWDPSQPSLSYNVVFVPTNVKVHIHTCTLIPVRKCCLSIQTLGFKSVQLLYSLTVWSSQPCNQVLNGGSYILSCLGQPAYRYAVIGLHRVALSYVIVSETSLEFT